MEVAYETFPDIIDSSHFITLVGERLSKHVVSVEGSERNPNIVRVMLKGDIPKNLLFHALPNPKGDEQQLVYLLRGMAHYGLEQKMFQKIFTSQGDFVTTFGLDYDGVTGENVLLVRNISNTNERGAFVEIELTDQYAQEFREALQNADTQEEASIQPSFVSREGIIVVDEAETLPGEPDKTEIPVIDQNIASGNGRVATDAQQFPDQVAEDTDSIALTGGTVFPGGNLLRRILDSGRQRRILKRHAKISEAERERVKQMEADLPGIVDAVYILDALIPQVRLETSFGGSAIEKYLAWRASGQFYGQLSDTAMYLTGKQLVELVTEQDQADIASVEVVKARTPEDRMRDALQVKLGQIVQRMNPSEDDVNDFELVLAPTDKQLAQLGLLRLYTQLTTGVDLPNDLFIFQGTGSKGINLGQKAIGMHESLFTVKFTEALRTFVHEVAHNYPEVADHGNMFRHAMESLFVTAIDRVSEIANKLVGGEDLSQEDKVILDMQKEWGKLVA